MNRMQQGAQSQHVSSLPRFDIYSAIHKALRACMSDTLGRVSRLDCADAQEVSAAALQVRELAAFCIGHLEHENDFVHTAMEARRPGSAAATGEDHVHHLHACRQLQALADEMENGPDATREAAATALRRYLAAFVADSFLHMNVEETDNNAVLWAAYSDAELLGIEHAIVASLKPEESAVSMRWMIPAMAPKERAMLLGGIRQGAPAPVFEGILAIARENLSLRDWGKLAAALQLEEKRAA
jgi:hypothetical protein